MTEEKRGPGRPPKKADDTIDCVVLRDFWPQENNRQRAGTIVSLPVVEAIDKIEAGLVSRYKGE